MKTENRIITAILEELDFELSDLVARKVAQYERIHQLPAPAWLAAHFRMELIYDMCKAIEKHTLSTDVLEHLSSSRAKYGSIIITASVIRDGITYSLITEIIHAGGWNIQRLHIRYITKTDLPKSLSLMPVSARIKTIIAVQRKQAKLEQELGWEQAYLEKAQEASLNAHKSDDELAQLFLILDPERARLIVKEWDDLHDHAKNNFHNSSEEFLIHQAEWLMSGVENLRFRADQAINRVSHHEKKILQLRAKQQELEEQIARALRL